MALALGSLYVSLRAEAGAFAAGMAGAMKHLEKFSNAAKKASGEVAKVSAVMAGIGAAALKMASSVDGPTKQAMGGLEKSTQLLAVQVADMLLPAVKELTTMFREAAGVVAGLDPELKKQISSFAVIAVQVAFAAKAFSLFAGLAGNVFGILKSGFSMIAAVGMGPLLSIVAAVGLVIAAVLLLHRAWRKNWGGIQEATQSVLKWFQAGFSQFAKFMGSVWDFLVDGAASFVAGLLKVGEVIESVTGKDLGVAGMREGFEGLWKDLKSGSFFSQAFTFGKTIALELAEGIADEAGRIKKEVSAALGLDKIKVAAPIAVGRGMGPGHPAGGGGGEHVSAAQHSGADRDRSGSSTKAAGLSQADVISSAVGAADWGEAQRILQSGVDGASDFGTTLSVWGQRMSGIFARAGGQIFGAVGQLVSSIAEGAKQGGIWGAFMAAIMEVVQAAASAMEFLGTAMNFVKQLGAMIEPLVKPVFDILTDVLGAVITIVGPIFTALKPLFEAITNVIGYLFPILSALGSLFEAIGPILEVVFKVIGMILQILEPIFKLIGGIIKIIATALLGFIIMLNEIAAAFGDEKAKEESKRLRGLVDKMWQEGADDRFRADSKAAGATLRNADAQDAAAAAAQKVAENLSNVPAGFNIANARYQADMGITSGNAYASGGGDGGVVINGNVTVTSSATTIGGVAADAKKEAARERGQRTGNPEPRERGSGGTR